MEDCYAHDDYKKLVKQFKIEEKRIEFLKELYFPENESFEKVLLISINC